MADAEFDVHAALLRRSADLPSMVADLAERLARAIPDRVDVERAGALHGRKVMALRVQLGEDSLRLSLDRRRVTAWIDRIVRGICIRSDEVTVDAWLQRLAEDLAAEATRSTEARLAIEDSLR